MIAVLGLFLFASCAHNTTTTDTSKPACSDCAKGASTCGDECKARKAAGGCDDCKDHKTEPAQAPSKKKS